MDIKFNVLIVDDSILDEDDSTYQKIKKKIEKMGLLPYIQLSNGSDYKQIIQTNDFDLYLVDYNLVNDISGHTVIREVRDNNRSLTDIILYSTMGENLYQKLDELKLDGVYVCTRDDLSLKAEQLLEKLEKRTLNPLSLRGIVLHNYSDIEFRLRKILLEKYHNQNKESRELISEQIITIIDDGVKQFNDKIEECKKSDDFVYSLFMGKNYLFDMGKKIKLLEFLKKQKIVNLAQKDINLLRSLNDKRNSLGHSQILIKNGEMVTQDINRSEHIYTLEECQYIKGEILRAISVLNSLEQQN